MKITGWRDVPPAGTITESGNSIEYETGTWRISRPIIDMDRCSHCMICWIFCPDGAVMVKDQRLIGFDLMHCKGCGICASECPRKAIEMKDEASLGEGA